MNVCHAPQCANWHDDSQVPNDTLRKMPIGSLNSRMAHEFQKAFRWHMDTYDTAIVDLVKATGVTRDVVNKLKGRSEASTSVENAILIASFYGKTVNQFIQLQEVSAADRFHNLLELLPPEDQQTLEAQIHGLLAVRAQKSSQQHPPLA